MEKAAYLWVWLMCIALVANCIQAADAIGTEPGREPSKQCTYGFDFTSGGTHNAVQLIVFGDSLLDDHNFACRQATVSNGFRFQRPYNSTGNTSNGLPFVHFLQRDLESLGMYVEPRVYAYAGARASTSVPASCSTAQFLPGLETPYCLARFPGLEEQVNTYIENLPNGYVPRNHAIFIMIGGNDILFSSQSPDALKAAAAAVGSAIKAACSTLVESGARQVFIGTLPPIEDTPILARTSDDVTRFVGQLRNVINAQLAFEDEQIAGKCTLVDIYGVSQRVISDVHDEGWEIQFPCLDFDAYIHAAAQAYPGQVMQDVADMLQCPDPCKNFWWDSVHPTECGYARIARELAPILAQELQRMIGFEAGRWQHAGIQMEE